MDDRRPNRGDCGVAKHWNRVKEAMSRTRFRVPIMLCLVALSLEAGLWLASWARTPLTFDVGPSTEAYLQGFTASWEYPPVRARFAGAVARIDLPVEVSGGDVKISIRTSRPWRTPLRTRLVAPNGSTVTFVAHPSGISLDEWAQEGRRFSPFEQMEIATGRIALPAGTFRITLVNDNARSAYALAVDWIRIEGARWKLRLSFWQPRLFTLSVLLLMMFAGHSFIAACRIAFGAAALISVGAAVDVFGLAHVAARLTVPSVLLTAACAFLFRSSAHRRWIALLFLVGYLLKGAGLFHPQFFYGDVRSHRRYLQAFSRAEGSLWARGSEAQLESRVGYPLRVVDKDYAFPYSPVFYLPFTLLDQGDTPIDEAMKHVALAASAAEVPLVYWLAQSVFGTGAAMMSTFLAVFLPPTYSRLFYAMWPAIVGHTMDMLLVGAAGLLAARPSDGRCLRRFAATAIASSGMYVTGPLISGSFVAALAVFVPTARRRLMVTFCLASGAVILFLYWPFASTFLGEILPGVWDAGGAVNTEKETLGHSLGRVPIFFGYSYLPLVLLALPIARSRPDPFSFKALSAYGVSFLALVVLRVLGGGMFNAMKEMLYLGPFIALTAGMTLTQLGEFGRRPKAIAWTIAAGLALFGLVKYVSYITPLTRLAGQN